jgi:hypothetical protein
MDGIITIIVAAVAVVIFIASVAVCNWNRTKLVLLVSALYNRYIEMFILSLKYSFLFILGKIFLCALKQRNFLR